MSDSKHEAKVTGTIVEPSRAESHCADAVDERDVEGNRHVLRLEPPLGASPSMRAPSGPRPSYLFLAVVSAVTLALDTVSKAWASRRLDNYQGYVDVWHGHLAFVLAKNRGGAWGILQSTSESIRRPFFLVVSVAAIVFIISLFRRLQPRQHALRWGLPLVLGGAMGNVLDRLRFGHVIDFIDAHGMIAGQDQHWPTFNVADVAICVGVGLMALDMFASKRRGPVAVGTSPSIAPAPSGEPAVDRPASGDGRQGGVDSSAEPKASEAKFPPPGGVGGQG